MKYHVEFILYRNSSLPLNPGEYDLESEFEGKFFSIWSCEIEEEQYSEVDGRLEYLKGRNKVVAYRMTKRPL